MSPIPTRKKMRRQIVSAVKRCIDLSILQQVNFVHVEAERNTANATEVTFAVIINQKDAVRVFG